MNDQKRSFLSTARVTGLWYLMLAITGMLGFLIIDPNIFIAGNSEQTLSNLINDKALARFRLILEFLIVISQALTAVWFYKLFMSVNKWAAWTLGVWGMVNAVAIMLSAVTIAVSISIAGSETLAFDEQLLLIELLRGLGANAWGAGSIFFALWLFPMGYVITKSKRMPLWLGRILIIGGVGYLLSTVLGYSGVDSSFVELLTIPATIGEFWMIGYLLVYGIRPAIEER